MHQHSLEWLGGANAPMQPPVSAPGHIYIFNIFCQIRIFEFWGQKFLRISLTFYMFLMCTCLLQKPRRRLIWSTAWSNHLGLPIAPRTPDRDPIGLGDLGRMKLFTVTMVVLFLVRLGTLWKWNHLTHFGLQAHKYTVKNELNILSFVFVSNSLNCYFNLKVKKNT